MGGGLKMGGLNRQLPNKPGSLVQFAKADPDTFYQLWAKMLPMEAQAPTDNPHLQTS